MGSLHLTGLVIALSASNCSSTSWPLCPHQSTRARAQSRYGYGYAVPPPTHLHCEHVMCMQPWFFSMGLWHLGQGLVLARIQLRFSLSALFLVSHLRTVAHDTCREGRRRGMR